MWSGTTPAGNSTVNGLNQTVSALGTALAYDGRGNLTTVGGVATYGYDAANRLTSAAGVATLSYDPLGRLYQVSDGATTRFGYDGGEIVLETDGSNAVLRRYVKGTGADETIAWYEGAGTSSRRWLMEDERGSVVAVADDTGAAIAINTYDEYGRPGSGNLGRFQYTGQAYIASLGLYYYKARFYAPSLGKFLQPDPIGYAGGMNLYAYVEGDPVNWSDPSGAFKCKNIYDQIGYTDSEGAQVVQLVWVGISCEREPADILLRMEYKPVKVDNPRAPSGGGGGNAEEGEEKEKQCIAPSDGPLYYEGMGGDAVIVAGVGVAELLFQIPSIGAQGRAFSISISGGLGGAGGVQVGVAPTVGGFLGWSLRASADFSVVSPYTGFDFTASLAADRINSAGVSGGFGIGAWGGVVKTWILESNLPLCEG